MKNKKRYISISMRPVVTKLDRIGMYDLEPKTNESHVPLFTWPRGVTWQIESVIFELP